MASATVMRELRIKARKLGVTNFRELDEEELKDAISDAKKSRNGKSSKKTATKAVKTIKRGRGRPRKVVEDDDEDDAPKKRGRPKGSVSKKRGRPAKAESTKKVSKRSSNTLGRPVGSGTGTRVAVPERIKWNRDFDFREGSTAQYILTALRKSAHKYSDTSDIREATFDKLVDKIGKVDELVFNNRSTGRPHKGEDAERMLRFRINQTIFQYATETGQHDGSGGNGSSTKKKAKATTTVKRGRGRPKKVVDDDDEDEDFEDDEDEDEDEPVKKRRGRPPGSGKKKATVKKRGPGRPPKSESVKRGPGRPKGSGTKKRGRPPGSKNKK